MLILCLSYAYPRPILGLTYTCPIPVLALFYACPSYPRPILGLPCAYPRPVLGLPIQVGGPVRHIFVVLRFLSIKEIVNSLFCSLQHGSRNSRHLEESSRKFLPTYRGI